MKRTRISLKAGVLRLPCALRDRLINRRYATAPRKFLIVRHPGKQPYRCGYILDWLERELPEVRSLFELRLVPCRVRDLSSYVLFAPWLQDPVEDWSPSAYAWTSKMAARCDEQNIPVINRVEHLSNSVKSIGSQRIASAGIRTPRIVPIRDIQAFQRDLGGLDLPLLIREDRGHGHGTVVVRNVTDLKHVHLSRFKHPIAVEFIDVSGKHDGLCRKYRYLAAGEIGVPRHLLISRTWEVRAKERVTTDASRDEELAYLNEPDPNHLRLQCARKALGLDVVAFDYSYDRNGHLVVWEANPYPGLEYLKGPRLAYTRPYVERSFAAIVKLYLKRSGLKIPSQIDDMLATDLRRQPLADAPCFSSRAVA